jgi:putative transposase
MPNHVHLVLVPFDADALRRVLSAVHRRYAGVMHARRRRTGAPAGGHWAKRS